MNTKVIEEKSNSIPPEKFVQELKKNDLGPVVEVPCSYLKDFLNYLWDSKEIPVINPTNEAVAMAIASGEYLGSDKIPIVAIQNSGFTNTLNALTSLNQIYDIPVFMMVTWRGEGGKGKDAPEHDITGENLLKYLETFEIPYEITDEKKYSNQIKRLSEKAKESKKPVAMVIKKNTFSLYEFSGDSDSNDFLEMDRMGAIETIKKELSSDEGAVFLSGTGFPSRDSFNASDTPDFYTMGSMGHVFGMGLGVARNNTDKKVIVLDGDGGALMHAGGFASLDPKIDKNLTYIMLDNGIYESTGGQLASSQNVDFKKLAEAFGFKYLETSNKKDLEKKLREMFSKEIPIFLRVMIKSGEHAGKRVSNKYTAPEVTERFKDNFR